MQHVIAQKSIEMDVVQGETVQPRPTETIRNSPEQNLTIQHGSNTNWQHLGAIAHPFPGTSKSFVAEAKLGRCRALENTFTSSSSDEEILVPSVRNTRQEHASNTNFISAAGPSTKLNNNNNAVSSTSLTSNVISQANSNVKLDNPSATSSATNEQKSNCKSPKKKKINTTNFKFKEF